MYVVCPSQYSGALIMKTISRRGKVVEASVCVVVGRGCRGTRTEKYQNHGNRALESCVGST